MTQDTVNIAELDINTLNLLPETENDGLKHRFCCVAVYVTAPLTTA